MSCSPTLTTETAVRDYGRLVLHVSWQILSDEDSVQDVFQDTFLQLHAFLDRGGHVAHPKAWLCRTAINNARKRLTRWGRFVALKEDQAADSHEEETHKGLLLERVRRLVQGLPERQQVVFVMRNFQGLSHQEISSELGCSVEASRASEYKALKQIREKLKETMTP